MAAKTAGLVYYRWPQWAIGRFVARRTLRGATLWALVFGVYVASKAVGYAAAYPTLRERVGIAASLGGNAGLNALLGVPHHMETVAGFTAWNCLGVMSIVGGIWALLLATKNFRGEEQNGRLELLLTGQTTTQRAALNTLLGIGGSLVVLYAVSALTFIAVGRVHTVGFAPGAASFFALCVTASAAMFIAVGALTSQLMPTRSRAAGLAALIFGVCFVLRAVADATNTPWLLNASPLGWIEKTQPLYATHAVWLLPCALFTLIISSVAVYMAGRRDLGESTLADRETAKPRYGLLNSPVFLAVRLLRGSAVAWVAGVSAVAAMFGLLTNTASQALNSSTAAQNTFERIAHTSQQANAEAFLGAIFLIIITFVMACAAHAVGAIREDEANGLVDNFLVRPVGRIRWLGGRLVLALAILVLAGLCSGLTTWLAEISQHAGVTFHSAMLAGVNTIAPALLVLGIGVVTLGYLPRFVSLE